MKRTAEERAEAAAARRNAPIGIPEKQGRVDMRDLPFAPPAPRVREAKGTRNGLSTYKPMNKVNPERREARRLETHGGPDGHANWVASLPCAVAFPELYEGPHTLKPWMMRTGQVRISDPHHVRTRGAGGTAEFCVPLDPPKHSELGTVGTDTFEAFYQINLWRIAALLWEHSPVREG